MCIRDRLGEPLLPLLPLFQRPWSKAKTRSSKKEIVRGVIITMREMLKKYESTDEVDEWNIYFTIGRNYRDAELEVIKADHTRLVFHFIHHA